MTRSCYLCSRKANENISLHRFPKEQQLRAKWLNACNLSEADDVSRIYICSCHFKEEEKRNKVDGKYAGKYILAGAVPSLLLRPEIYNKIVVNVSNESVQHQATIIKDDVEDVQNVMEGSSQEEVCPPKKRRFSEPRYISELTVSDVATPKRAKRVIALVKRNDARNQEKIKKLQRQKRDLLKHITCLEEMMKHLQQQGLVSENARESIMNMLPDNAKEILQRKLRGKGKYSPKLRSFALTLHFYSPKAYNYVRKTWDNLLPAPSTIKKWYQVINGSPGFTKEALDAIAQRAKQLSTPVIVNLVLDEMAIREQIIFHEGAFHGGVDCGMVQEANDNDVPPPAKNALVFMAVSLNDSWKVPIGYFLIQSLSGSERANLLNEALQFLHERNCKVYSVTFDGAASNLAMCAALGANVQYGTPQFQPYFINCVTSEKCFIFYDLCHALKLVRNVLGDKKILTTTSGETIKWEYLKRLYELQDKEGLRAGNKITKKHIEFQNHRMNVSLAMQTLSKSVADSLKFFRTMSDTKIATEFKDSGATEMFCLTFNNIADMLNCKNKFSKEKYNTPVTTDNYFQLQAYANEFEKYINILCDAYGTPILKTNRKTGFLGIIICLRNIFPLFQQLRNIGQIYLLTYKLSQDYIETFFSAIRSRGGFNNNPNAIQFKSAYKRLLIRHEVKEFENGNCLFDGVDILHVSSQNLKCPIGDPRLLHEGIDIAHDYVKTFWRLTPFVENIVLYIAGYVSHKVKNVVKCAICQAQLVDAETDLPTLSAIKNRGPYVTPSRDVSRICQTSEKILRQSSKDLGVRNVKLYLLNKIFGSIGIPFCNDIMDDHTKTQDILDNHRTQLCKYIINYYLNVRLHHEAKEMIIEKKYIRHKLTKLILFNHQ